ncbi:MAG: hypothetical protein K1000chlam2_01035, partial [Chlamydiae bacterium]|nr:hypothetical protein [Chlamydiota bacterium]
EILTKYFDDSVEKIDNGYYAALDPNSVHDIKLTQIGWRKSAAFADYMLSEVMASDPNDCRLYMVRRINETRGFVADNLQVVLKSEDDWIENRCC